MSIQAFSVNIPEISKLYLGTENECKFKLFQSILQILAYHKLEQKMGVNFFCPYPRNLLTLFWDRCRILIQAVPVHITKISFLYTRTENECKFKLFLSISQKLDTIFWDRCIILIQAIPVHIQEKGFLYTGTDNECKFKVFLSIYQKLTYNILGQTLHFSSSFFCQYPRN
jgi:hypothetical protein